MKHYTFADISTSNLLILEFTHKNSIICKIIQNLSHHFLIILCNPKAILIALHAPFGALITSISVTATSLTHNNFDQ